ncbi:hypothetical protein GCM10022206_71990 [Streptomyces chiangmaiensis]
MRLRPPECALRDHGAAVTGIDASAGMLALAGRRLGDDGALHVVYLRDRLPFDDGAFDDVVASLVLHYLEDWGPTLAELRRVLRPGGRLIASVDHPLWPMRSRILGPTTLQPPAIHSTGRSTGSLSR